MTTALFLLADIGGTNARFALSRAGGSPFAERTLATADFDGPVTAARAYLGLSGEAEAPRRAAFSIACPVLDDAIALTNSPWRFSIAATQDALGLDRLTVVNDFVGQALAVPHLRADDLIAVGGGTARPGFPIAVIGPGTGLGQALLVPGGHGRWKGVATEGGHATMAPADADEGALLDVLRQRFGHVSAERVISGQGLVNLYEAHCALAGTPAAARQPADVTRAALDGDDPACVAALDSFFSLLGTAAGNLALTSGALGGVYLAGGILPRLIEALRCSPFRARFEDKGRFSAYNKAIPTTLVIHPNPAFIGLASLVA